MSDRNVACAVLVRHKTLTVRSKSVCSHSNCMFCSTVLRQCLILWIGAFKRPTRHTQDIRCLQSVRCTLPIKQRPTRHTQDIRCLQSVRCTLPIKQRHTWHTQEIRCLQSVRCTQPLDNVIHGKDRNSTAFRIHPYSAVSYTHLTLPTRRTV